MNSSSFVVLIILLNVITNTNGLDCYKCNGGIECVYPEVFLVPSVRVLQETCTTNQVCWKTTLYGNVIRGCNSLDNCPNSGSNNELCCSTDLCNRSTEIEKHFLIFPLILLGNFFSFLL
ncbi:hypothetical protein SNEBB_001310 [Seison nebaliae]|nr:hypothetical protein SNEBB_001310 [Seison nebaliae]